MSRTNDMNVVIDSLINCGKALVDAGRALKDFYSEEKTTVPQEGPDTTPPDETRMFTKEEVRAILAKKANEEDGKFKAEVRAIVQKYGNGGSLTDVDAKDYANIMREIENLGSA